MLKFTLVISLFMMLSSSFCAAHAAEKSGVEEQKVGPKIYLVKHPALLNLTVRDGTITVSLAEGQTLDPKLSLGWIIVSEKEGQVMNKVIHSPVPFSVKLDSLLFLPENARYHLFIDAFERPRHLCISNIVGVSKSNGRYLVRKQ